MAKFPTPKDSNELQTILDSWVSDATPKSRNITLVRWLAAHGVILVPELPTAGMTEAMGIDDDLDPEGALTDAITASPFAPK